MALIEMKNITKTYPGTVALDNVDFELQKGEIVSLLGENGAGKTTLMKVLYGMTSPDNGEVYFKGEKVDIRTPMDAINMGICMVHQHFMLVPAFSVSDNIIAGYEPKNGIFLDNNKAKQMVKDLIEEFKFNIDANIKVEKLSVGEQQRVEILKALYREAEVLILDEPTAVLTPHEVDDLFVILDKLRKQGKSIVIITHKLRETIAIADRVSVIRDGKMIRNDVNPSLTTVEELSEMMVGRQIELGVRNPAENIGEVYLRLKDLKVVEDNIVKIKDVSFDIRKGEILGIAGIEGNGQTQLLESLTGLNKPEHMELYIDEKPISGNADKFLESGIGHIPEDRLKMGLAEDMSIKNNLILGYHRGKDISKNGILNNKKIREYAKTAKEDYLVKAPSIDTSIKSLSGGNQQKVIIARTFSHDPDVIIAAHPTRGVDVGAMEYIHRKLIELRDKGKAVLLVSADLDEVRTLSDRILVLYEGNVVSESMPGELSEVQLGLLMTGSAISSKEE